MDHRRFEMRKREVWIEVHRARERTQAVFSPFRVSEPELVAPITWLERYRAFWEESFQRLDGLLDELQKKERDDAGKK